MKLQGVTNSNAAQRPAPARAPQPAPATPLQKEEQQRQAIQREQERSRQILLSGAQGGPLKTTYRPEERVLQLQRINPEERLRQLMDYDEVKRLLYLSSPYRQQKSENLITLADPGKKLNLQG